MTARFSLVRSQIDPATDDLTEIFYSNAEQRDAWAKQYAAEDDEPIDCFETDDNGTHWLTGRMYPPGTEPEPVDQRNRFNADAIVKGDTVTVFGCPARGWLAPTEWGQVKNEDHTGTVSSKTELTLPFTVIPGWRLMFNDGRVVDCIAHAVVTMHDLSNNITKEI